MYDTLIRKPHSGRWVGVLLVLFSGALLPWDRLLPGENIPLITTGRHVDRPEVLVVSRDARDRFSVATTVEPRGYHVIVAPTVESGLEQLRMSCGQIGMVVLDTALPHAQRMVNAVRSGCPVYMVSLAGPRQPAQVAQLLMPGLT